MGSYKKKLSIVLLLFLLINFCVCSSVNAGMDDIQYTIEVAQLLKDQQEYLARIGITYINNYATDTIKTNFSTWINNNSYYTLWKYYYNANACYITCYFIPYNVNWTNQNSNLMDLEDAYFEDVYNIYPVSGYQIPPSNLNMSNYHRFIIPLYASTASEGNYANAIFIPSLLIDYNNNVVMNYKNGINPTTSPWAMVMSAINNNTDAVEDTTQAVNNLRNDFNEEESSEDYSYPTDNPTEDITESSIDGVFSLFYMKINAWDDALMRIPIPFTGKYFDIPSNLTQNLLNSFPAGNVIGRLLGLIWYYLLGVYIIKDVQKYIDGLQTGEILTKSDTNIKTEML